MLPLETLSIARTAHEPSWASLHVAASRPVVPVMTPPPGQTIPPSRTMSDAHWPKCAPKWKLVESSSCACPSSLAISTTNRTHSRLAIIVAVRG